MTNQEVNPQLASRVERIGHTICLKFDSPDDAADATDALNQKHQSHFKIDQDFQSPLLWIELDNRNEALQVENMIFDLLQGDNSNRWNR
jgi:hypothetical protein